MCSTLHCFNYCALGPMCDVPISPSTPTPLNGHWTSTSLMLMLDAQLQQPANQKISQDSQITIYTKRQLISHQHSEHTLTNTTPTDKINTIAKFKETKNSKRQKNREKQNINKALIHSAGQSKRERELLSDSFGQPNSQSERERERELLS